MTSQAALQRFVVGVAYRMEDLQAHELTELMDTTALSAEDRASLVEKIEFSLGLLAAFGRLLREADDDSEVLSAHDDPVGPGDLVI
ncbi:MAG TPA: hypothetical protein VMZ51_01905 [Acidimicrobiales bacterium]|nr:hypothetical protein [Acidimicrobiales bacterium]